MHQERAERGGRLRTHLALLTVPRFRSLQSTVLYSPAPQVVAEPDRLRRSGGPPSHQGRYNEVRR